MILVRSTLTTATLALALAAGCGQAGDTSHDYDEMPHHDEDAGVSPAEESGELGNTQQALISTGTLGISKPFLANHDGDDGPGCTWQDCHQEETDCNREATTSEQGEMCSLAAIWCQWVCSPPKR